MQNNELAVKVIKDLLDAISKTPCADTLLDSTEAGSAFEFVAAAQSSAYNPEQSA